LSEEEAGGTGTDYEDFHIAVDAKLTATEINTFMR